MTKMTKAIQKQNDIFLRKMKKSLRDISEELNSAFFERKPVIECLLTTLIANENIALVGTPGTGKSALVNAFTELIDGKFFSYQMNGFTQPEDVLGSVSFKELRENDKRILKTSNMAPEAEIVYLGEAFKANNTMMNSLLLLLNEREVDIGDGVRQSTNNRMIVADSNEYPTDGELGAFWDRWTCRLEVEEIKHDSSFESFFSGYGSTTSVGVVDVSKAVSMQDVDKLRGMLWMVDSSVVLPVVKNIRTQLRINNIIISTRRWGKIKKMIHASALLNGRLEAKKSDLGILQHCLWRTVSERDAIAGLISACIGGDAHDARRLYSHLNEIFQNKYAKGNFASGPAGLAQIAPILAECKGIFSELESLDQTEEEVSNVTVLASDIIQRIKQDISSRLG